MDVNNPEAKENEARENRDAEPPRVTFGVERIGLLSLRFPIVALITLVIVSIIAAFGVMQLRVDDSLSQLFRSDTPEFRMFEEVSDRFPSAEFDTLVIVEGNVLTRDALEGLRTLVQDLQLVEGTRGIISLFSARQAPEGDHLPEPLIPDPLPPDGPEFDKLIDQINSNEVISGKLLSADGELALIVLALDPKAVETDGLSTIVDEIRQYTEEDLAGTGLTGRLSGVPVMQLEVRNAVERDRLIYNAIGFIAGCVIAMVFFRRLPFMVMAAGPPLLAILLSLGVLGWLGFRLNMFLNVMTPLIMVMGFSDSMQLTFAARDRLLDGDTKAQALKRALLTVGPAVVITDITAALSFCALIFSESDLIRTFGIAGALTCFIAFLAVVLLVPLAGMLLLRSDDSMARKTSGRSDVAVDALRRICAWIAGHMVRRPGFYSLVSLVIVGGLLAVYASLTPQYRLAEQVPDKEEAVAASASVDAKLEGANPIDVYVKLPAGQTLYSPETLEVISAVHTAVENQPSVANVWSLETLRRWLMEKTGGANPDLLKEYVDALPTFLTGRFISAEQNAVVISGRVPDRDSAQLLPVIDGLEKALDAVRTAHAGYEMAVTGLSAIAARNSASMIEQLNSGLTYEMVFVAALIGLAFRSVLVMVVAILPGLFPIVMAGTALYLLGDGLQFASIVALTVAFGLGLDATIHFLNRLRLEDNPAEDPAEGVKRATVLVGPALILTSLVLACGLAVTVFSDLPSLQMFGWLSAFTLLAALVGDLLILPATVTFLRRLIRRFRKPRTAAAE